MALFNEETTTQLKDILSGLNKTVNVVLFTDEKDCETCKDTTEFLNEIKILSDKIQLKQYDIKKDSEVAKAWNIDKTPAIQKKRILV